MPILENSRDSNFTDFGMKVLKDLYLLENETPQEALGRASTAFADDEAHAQRLYDYVSKHWFMFATPLLSNGGTTRGLPISCNLSKVDDSRRGIVDNWEETMFLATNGAGIGVDMSSLRSDGVKTSKGSRSTGVIPFLKALDSIVIACRQGDNRRAAHAVYLDISHPEIEEFIYLRKATGGDHDRKCLNTHIAINITDEFMEAVRLDKPFDLVDPHNKSHKKTVSAKGLWRKILDARVLTGEPFLHFIDTSNRAFKENCPTLWAEGKRINQSNLCTEIFLPTAPDYTNVCCLSSVNAFKYDEWRDDPLFIEDLIRMLDNALSVYIDTAPKELWRAVAAAKHERSIGLGLLGWHSYLQKNMVPFESAMAIGLLNNIHSKILKEATAATQKLAIERGEPEGLKGTGRRNAHLIAVAPNAKSSILCGDVSPSIEPIATNAYVKKTDTARHRWLNPLLVPHVGTDKEVWDSIIENNGSVQHLPFLSQDVKDVFKTAFEIDQMWVIEQAKHRQKWIDQGQSINLFFNEGEDARVVNKVHGSAWKAGLKSLYYYRMQKKATSDNLNAPVARKVTKAVEEEEDCIACQG